MRRMLGDLPSVLLYALQPTHSTPVPSISPIVRPPYAKALAYGIAQLPLPSVVSQHILAAIARVHLTL